MSGIVLVFDWLLILGNSQVFMSYCEYKPLIKAFLNVIDSFNQWVTDPTHLKGHILDLVLGFGWVHHRNIKIVCFWSFSCALHLNSSVAKLHSPVHKRQAFIALREPQFSVRLIKSGIMNSSCESFEDLSYIFNSTCIDILESIAVLRPVCAKPLLEPCLNEHMCTLRVDCRRTKRRWKNDKLYVSLQSLQPLSTQRDSS